MQNDQHHKNALNRSESSPLPVTWVAVPQAAVEPNDEISLIDLWLVLVRRRSLILGVFAAVMAVGVLVALLLPPKYEFTTTVRIGQVPVTLSEGGEKSIESPETVLANVQESYLPPVQAEMRERLGPDTPIDEIDAEIEKGSEVLVLKLRAPEDRAALCMELLEKVTARLVADHKALAQHVAKQLATQLEKVKIRLEELEDPLVFMVQKNKLERQIKEVESALGALRSGEKLALAQLELLYERRRLLEQQIADLTEAIGLARRNRSQAALETSEPGQAMTVLLIDNEIRQNQIVLNQLQNALEVGLKHDKDQLTKTLEDARKEQEAKAARLIELRSQLEKLEIDRTRRQQEQQQVVNEMEARLATVRQTEVVLPPMKSINPVGVGKVLLLGVAAMAGLMLGVVAALLAEFSAKARMELNSRG